MQFVEQMAITTFFWVPSVMTGVANFKILDVLAPASIRKILFAGEVMPTRTLNYWLEQIPQGAVLQIFTDRPRSPWIAPTIPWTVIFRIRNVADRFPLLQHGHSLS